MRRVVILAAVIGLMLPIFAGTALAVTRVGTGGPDRLVGTPENDTLRGRGGADNLIGRGDSDRLLGGRGNDLIKARERGRAEDDLIDCGWGRDTVFTNTLPRTGSEPSARSSGEARRPRRRYKVGRGLAP